jgi:hypothetical protein
MSQPNANPAPRIEAVDLDRLWSESAMADEYTQLANLPAQKVQKPGSVFSVTLLKIASIIKGSGRHVSPDQALAKIISICGSPSLPNREIERQWKRAYAKANARFRDTAVSANGHGNGQAEPAAANKPDIDIKNPKTRDYLRGFEALEYKFRLNLLDDSVECNGERLSDSHEAIIFNRMRDIGLNNTGWVERAYRQAAFKNRFHPVQDYFNSLEWDGEDWIARLFDGYITETTGMGYAALRRWMIGAVAKVFEQGQNFMLVLDGPQDTGKSTFARWLCPLPGFFIEGSISPDDKDSFIRLCTKFVWEVGELQATTRKADREALKHFITCQEVTVRKAYGRHDLIKPALASLIGTINEDGAGFLTDPTGNRRFVIICLKKINFAYSTELDIKNLWAQAVELYRVGTPWRLSAEEANKQRAINIEYEMLSAVATKFFEIYAIDPNSETIVTLDDIVSGLELAGLRSSQQATIQEVARLMKKLGIEKFRARVGLRRPTAYRGIVPVGKVVL